VRARLVTVLVTAACGSSAPPPAPVAAPARVAVAPPAPVTCGDAGVILRGPVADERDAGPAKEAAIARACLHGAWSAEVLACVGTSVTPAACLDQLAAAQRTGYHAQLLAWNDEFPDEELLEDVSDAIAPEPVECAVAIGDVATLAPAITTPGVLGDLPLALRRNRVLALCERWATPVRGCFADGTPAEDCRGQLPVDQQQALTDALAELDRLVGKATMFAARPASIGCKQVVAAHYTDAAWTGKLAALGPATRKPLIAASRAQMIKACTADAWSVQLRACIVAAAPGPDAACFAATPETTATAWGFPALGLLTKTGIPACDAWGDALRALARCPQIPTAATQAMLDAFQQTAAALASTAPADRAARVNACKQADAAVRQSATAVGCAI